MGPLEEFKTTLYRFAWNYKAVARWAFVRRDGVQFLLRGVIRVNPREIPKDKSQRDYGNLLLREDVLEVDEVEKLAIISGRHMERNESRPGRSSPCDRPKIRGSASSPSSVAVPITPALPGGHFPPGARIPSSPSTESFYTMSYPKRGTQEYDSPATYCENR